MIKRTFIHAFWGDQSDIHSRSHKVRHDLVRAAGRRGRGPALESLFFVWGRDNKDYLTELGFDRIELVSEAPLMQKPAMPRDAVWRHKFVACQLAMQRYEQIVFLDIDIRLLIPVPDDFWDRLGQKDRFQANLLIYKRKKCPWRKSEPRKRPSAAFMYFRDPVVVDELLAVDEQKPWGFLGSEETALAWWTDQEQGGWKSALAYARRFEPYCCILPNKSGFSLQDPQERAIREAKVGVFHY
jgi:hypothetical protein